MEDLEARISRLYDRLESSNLSHSDRENFIQLLDRLEAKRRESM